MSDQDRRERLLTDTSRHVVPEVCGQLRRSRRERRAQMPRVSVESEIRVLIPQSIPMIRQILVRLKYTVMDR